MDYRERIEAALEGPPEVKDRARPILRQVGDAYDQGGSEEVTSFLKEHMRDFEANFRDKLEALEDILAR